MTADEEVDPPRTPEAGALYRLQFGAGVDFAQAARLTDYLARLGVTHLYASPCLQAAPGSTHGYDVVDPSRVSGGLGGEEGYLHLVRSLKEAGIGKILDIVPNHMAVPGPENPWWWDVLSHGISSRYAGHFDVDWWAAEGVAPPPSPASLSMDGGPGSDDRTNAILLPVLDDHVGRVVDEGRIRLNREGGRITVEFEDHRFPVDVAALGALLEEAAGRLGEEAPAEADELGVLARAFKGLPECQRPGDPAAHRRHRESQVLFRYLTRLLADSPSVAGALDRVVASINGDAARMDGFLARQNYRLAHWRLAGSELGYRRFFHINELVALRMEREEVFRDAHVRILEALREGQIQGVRIDHPDGLLDPEGYLRRFAREAPEAWVVAEKILETGEALPTGWPLEGTTGYDFLHLVGGLFVDPSEEGSLTELHREFTGREVSYREEVLSCKRLAFRRLLGSDLNRLVEQLRGICREHPRERDHRTVDLRDALVEVAAAFPVYRTYIRPEDPEPSPEDAGIITDAVEAAAEAAPHLWPDPLRFIQELLLLRHDGALERRFVLRFQQLTGPVMAKGVEDTAFYRHHRLISLNEVGGDPARFGVSVEVFHRWCQAARARRPRGLLTTSTHDTKRSEDVRARLHVLSEIPDLWARTVRRWRRMHQAVRGPVDGGTEYLIYQTLVGAWPLSEDRLCGFVEKAVREAKLHTSWTDPNREYDEAVLAFCRRLLAHREFLDELEALVEVVRGTGRVNSLAQTLLKLTAPGVPDLYQGCELWDLSLVDPDNRRPVDFQRRRDLLRRLEEGDGPDFSMGAVMEGMDEGLPKLHLIRRTLALRKERRDSFGAMGGYRPLEVGGRHNRRVVAFLRGNDVAVVVPRLAHGLRLLAGAQGPPADGERWGDTSVVLPDGRWRNRLTGEEWNGGDVRMGDLLDSFPVAVLAREVAT